MSIRKRLALLLALPALALGITACGTTIEAACAPYGGVAQANDEEGYCNARDASGDRVEVEKDGLDWAVDAD